MGRRIVAAHDPVRVAPYSFDSVRPHQRIDPRCNAAPIIFHTSKSVDRTERTVRAGRNQQFTGQAGVDRHSRDDAWSLPEGSDTGPARTYPPLS